jgi:hypothetical protein
MAQSLQVKKISWWHERLADWMLANPDKTLGEAAELFQCSRSHLSIIKNSDSFKIYWEVRSGTYSGEVVEKSTNSLVGVQEKAGAAAEQALDELNRRLEQAPEVMPVQQLLDITKVGMSALGYGAKANGPGPNSPSVNVNINTGLVTQADLEKARNKVFESHGLKVAEPAPVAPRAPLDLPYEVMED